MEIVPSIRRWLVTGRPSALICSMSAKVKADFPLVLAVDADAVSSADRAEKQEAVHLQLAGLVQALQAGFAEHLALCGERHGLGTEGAVTEVVAFAWSVNILFW